VGVYDSLPTVMKVVGVFVRFFFIAPLRNFLYFRPLQAYSEILKAWNGVQVYAAWSTGKLEGRLGIR
jgi:hypothetical protein